MKRWASMLWLSALVLLCGCGGGGYQPPTGGTGGVTPPSSAANVIGDWQFSVTSTVSGAPPLTIAGSISLSGSSVSGAVHVNGSNCFDPLSTVGLAGTLTGGNLSLATTSVAGQVATFTGSTTKSALTDPYSPGQFTGTYTINGGCADGDAGNVTGIKVPYVANILNGTFTASGGEAFSMTGDAAQYVNASPEGSFGISGKATFAGSCFSSGTITPGMFPAGSFIIGTSVAFKIETDNGTVTFLGTEDMGSGQISGNYTVSGGTCDQSGTAVLVGTSPWDY
jgi:hypothetical protein